MEYVEKFLDSDMSVHKTGKSIAIRLDVPIIDFKNDFNNYLNEMKISLDHAMRLLDILSKIDVNKLYQI